MIYLGVDLGKRVNFTAFAGVEQMEGVVEGFDYVKWLATRERWRGGKVVRYLERMRLGTGYEAVAQRVVEVAGDPCMRGRCRVVMDATGVGAAVVERVRALAPRIDLVPVVMTGGLGARYDGRQWLVPKLDLMAGLQMALETGELQIVRDMPERETLVRELLAVKGKMGERGRVKVGAAGVGEHDDLVVAVALAVWAGRMAEIGEKDRRLTGI